MIKSTKTKANQLVCDECGSILENEHGTTMFYNLIELSKLAEMYEWEPSGEKGTFFDTESSTAIFTDAPLHFCSRKCLCKHFGWAIKDQENHTCFCANCKKKMSAQRMTDLISDMTIKGWFGGAYVGNKLNIGSVHNPILNRFYFCSLKCAKEYQHKHKKQ